MKTSELQGAALDWAVEKANGGDHTYNPRGYSMDWAFGGPIIEREKIRLDCAWSDGPWEGSCKIDGVTGWMTGPAPLIAAMRCYVASKLGNEVEIPEDLK